MSSEKTTNCRIALRGMTTLKNRRLIPGKPYHYIYDALFSCADPALVQEDGIGSFRHYIGRDDSIKQDGTYETFTKIAGYQPGRNITSDEISDKDINVLGEIDTMQPLFDDDDKQLMYDDTINVTVAGTVISTMKESCTFFMHGTQYIGGQQEEVAVRAHMNRNPKWKNPSAVLPRAKAVIGFDGCLDGFEVFTPQNRTEKITRIVVAVQDISFLQPPLEESTNASKISAKNSPQKSVCDKVKRRKQKKPKLEPKSVPSTPEESHTVIASSSQNVLGKHDASSSEDNLDKTTLL